MTRQVGEWRELFSWYSRVVTPLCRQLERKGPFGSRKRPVVVFSANKSSLNGVLANESA